MHRDSTCFLPDGDLWRAIAADRAQLSGLDYSLLVSAAIPCAPRTPDRRAGDCSLEDRCCRASAPRGAVDHPGMDRLVPSLPGGSGLLGRLRQPFDLDRGVQLDAAGVARRGDDIRSAEEADAGDPCMPLDLLQ